MKIKNENKKRKKDEFIKKIWLKKENSVHNI